MEFLWNPWNVLTRMRRRRKKKENDTFCTSQVGTIKSLLAPHCSALSMSFKDSVLILKRPLNNEYINAVRLFCRGFYKLRCYVLNTHGSRRIFSWALANSTFFGRDLLPLILINLWPYKY